ncbi:helix-turn-helix transcriptional regulator [Flavobacterium sp. CYK-55]|uniref:helix-turn-helix domain-containing protein n=1 Tax=Flavobacterium sp. CYK-55 TaxID=2835529 RepID=UPI001BCAA87B|nr:helix-turn-helix transcriptional regulator [Flavobacterium sp. CYK-55]MBS7787477.1 helix-turn-helix transcriptional regulator [Flavobacterium sp. CYK-55]
MKKTVKLNKMLGLNQYDVAMLMGITRSQWSMFESGKRQLPHQATLLLSEILKHLNDFDNQGFEHHQQEIAQKNGKNCNAKMNLNCLKLKKR